MYGCAYTYVHMPCFRPDVKYQLAYGASLGTQVFAHMYLLPWPDLTRDWGYRLGGDSRRIWTYATDAILGAQRRRSTGIVFAHDARFLRSVETCKKKCTVYKNIAVAPTSSLAFVKKPILWWQKELADQVFHFRNEDSADFRRHANTSKLKSKDTHAPDGLLWKNNKPKHPCMSHTPMIWSRPPQV